MKRIIIFLLINIAMPLAMPAQTYTDTIIRGVSVQFKYSRSIFPKSWLTADIDAKGKPIIPGEFNRTKLIMANGLSKYPDSLLHKELRAVYFLKEMSMYHVEFGGTNSTDAIYLINNGMEQGYTDLYVEQTFHHEFSSILFRNHPSFLDTVSWKAANMPGFDYNDPEAGVGAIRNDHSSQDLDTALCRQGFLTQYAYSGIENDINTFAQNLFRPANGFWDIVNTYPRIKEKLRLLIQFYSKLNPTFNQQFFMKMN